MNTLVDAHIDRWAEIWRANPRLHAIPFSQFLTNPDHWLAVFVFLAPEPVDDKTAWSLPAATRRIADRLLVAEIVADAVGRLPGPPVTAVAVLHGHAADMEDALPPAARHTGVGFIEPLRHHAYAVSPHRGMRRCPR